MAQAESRVERHAFIKGFHGRSSRANAAMTRFRYIAFRASIIFDVNEARR